jgi:enamine deaminase RidA (YjgF/YER057c/UK114 family)
MTVKRHAPSKILSSCTEGGGMVFTAGVVAEDTSKDIKGQTQDILSQIDKLLAAAGTDKSKVLYTQIWITDIRNRDAMNEIWLKWVDAKHLPARACVEARLADPRMLIEIQMTAVK